MRRRPFRFGRARHEADRRLQDWKPLKRNTLLGFARIHVVEMDLVVHDVAVHESHGKRWAQLPSRPWVKGNEVVTDDAGKIRYSPLLEFPRKEVRDASASA